MPKKSLKPGTSRRILRIPKVEDYPKHLFLKSEKYRIRFVKGLKDIGQTDSTKREIRIRAGMSDNETFKTFIHEVLHFIEFEWPMKIRHSQVYELEKAIFDFIVDNFV